MSIVITTPTGNIGSAITRNLLDAGEKPVLIARDASKVAEFVERGASVIEGSHRDPALLAEAAAGADTLFLLTPPDYGVEDFGALYGSYAEAAVQAVKESGITRVVHLSSVGAELESGNGPVAGLHVAEGILDAGGIPNLVHLRPAYFMENTLMQIPNIQQAGSLFTNFPEGTRFPMIATRDIAARAAGLLLDRGWSGRSVVELQGSEEIGYDEVAKILSARLGREIAHVTVSDEQLVEAIMGMGASRTLAEGLAELGRAVTAGTLAFHEPRGESNVTPTTYAEFAEQVFVPVMAASAKA